MFESLFVLCNNKDFNLENEYLVRVMVLSLLPVICFIHPHLSDKKFTMFMKTGTELGKQNSARARKSQQIQTFRTEESFVNVIGELGMCFVKMRSRDPRA